MIHQSGHNNHHHQLENVVGEVIINGKNKTQIVRETLESLGFMKADVPEGWLGRVKRRLEAQKVSVHETVIYQTRKAQIIVDQKAKDKVNAQAAAAIAALPAPAVVIAPVVEATNGVMSLTLADATEIKAFAKKFGGFKQLVEAVQAVETLSE